MRKTVVIKELYQGYILNDGKKEYALEWEGLESRIGTIIMKLLDDCGGNTCTIVIEGPDKKEEKKKP